jgi:hypothetical protein
MTTTTCPHCHATQGDISGVCISCGNAIDDRYDERNFITPNAAEFCKRIFSALFVLLVTYLLITAIIEQDNPPPDNSTADTGRAAPENPTPPDAGGAGANTGGTTSPNPVRRGSGEDGPDPANEFERELRKYDRKLDY